MNVIGDIEITEEEPHIKYGEKWSYVPKENHGAIHDNQEVEEEPQFNSFQKQSSSPDLRFQSDEQDIDARSITTKFPVHDDVIHNSTDDVFAAHNQSNVRLSFAEDNSRVVNHVEEPSIPPTASPPSPPMPTKPEPAEAEVTPVRERRRRRRKNTSDVSATSSPQVEVRNESDMQNRTRQAHTIAQQKDDAIPVTVIDDAVIYDVPKPHPQRAVSVTEDQSDRRAHVNVVRRSRRTRNQRPQSVSLRRNSADVKMQIWMENDKDFENILNFDADSKDEPTPPGVPMRKSSPTEQSFFDRAKVEDFT